MQPRPAARGFLRSPIIFGEQDAYFDADVVIGDLQARLGTPDANITRIPEAGHYLQAHAPEAYVSALIGFLDT